MNDSGNREDSGDSAIDELGTDSGPMRMLRAVGKWLWEQALLGVIPASVIFLVLMTVGLALGVPAGQWVPFAIECGLIGGAGMMLADLPRRALMEGEYSDKQAKIPLNIGLGLGGIAVLAVGVVVSVDPTAMAKPLLALTLAGGLPLVLGTAGTVAVRIRNRGQLVSVSGSESAPLIALRSSSYRNLMRDGILPSVGQITTAPGVVMAGLYVADRISESAESSATVELMRVGVVLVGIVVVNGSHAVIVGRDMLEAFKTTQQRRIANVTDDDISDGEDTESDDAEQESCWSSCLGRFRVGNSE